MGTQSEMRAEVALFSADSHGSPPSPAGPRSPGPQVPCPPRRTTCWAKKWAGGGPCVPTGGWVIK